MDHCFFRQVFQKRIILLGNKTDTVFILSGMDKFNSFYHYFKNLLRNTIDIVYLRSNDRVICYIAFQIKQKIIMLRFSDILDRGRSRKPLLLMNSDKL